MSLVGHVESLWRYPVKSMRGEKLDNAYVGFSGIYGDRIFALHNPAGRAILPYLTGRELAEMLLYRPKFRDPGKALRPPNLTEAESIPPGATPVYAEPAELLVDIETSDGDVLAIDSPVLHDRLQARSGVPKPLSLRRSDRAMTDCRPVSLISIQTAEALGQALGMTVDQRRFRANIYVDLDATTGFAEDKLLGRSVRIGAKAVISVVERDPRCKMITLDPDTAQASPEVLRRVAQAHNGMAGVYGAVLVEGTIHPGDEITVLN
jgi:uncharacterized protein